VAPGDRADEVQAGRGARGAPGVTTVAAKGAGRTALRGNAGTQDVVRIEVVVTTEVADAITDYLREDVMPCYRVTACVETVDVLSPKQFMEGPEA
jgi:hypothetical protein